MRRLAGLLLFTGFFHVGCGDDAPANDAGADASVPTDAGADASVSPDAGGDSGVALDAGADAGPLDSGNDAGVTVLDLFPLRVGAVWTFQVTDTAGGTGGTKTQTVLRTTTLPNATGDVFELETVKPGGKRTVSYQQDIGQDVIRFKEDNFDQQSVLTGGEVYAPYKLRVPKALTTVAAMRTETFQEQTLDGTGAVLTDTNKTVEWTVEAVESITVPAGTFDGAIRMRKNTLGTQSDKLFWFVDGVGKVKEVGIGQTEELSSYSIP